MVMVEAFDQASIEKKIWNMERKVNRCGGRKLRKAYMKFYPQLQFCSYCGPLKLILHEMKLAIT
jgi:hypothetical protein